MKLGVTLCKARGKGARSWTEAIPTSNQLALGPNKFHLAGCLRMGAFFGASILS